MSRPAGLIAWSPPWARYVSGEYEPERFDEDGEREPQKVFARCAFCGTEWQAECPRGRVRERIAKFAAQHRHDRDPFGQ
jgi:hypothetical protein